ncbi:hypothetical protein TUM4644_33370 [Shewanella colwelliana]|uniref:hypothetical protein n=1 Tax=Shewanella colwelliana TaxID=23 RepID=UPI001BC59A03|nr:hypothetical protein [Shewanella colwelliana]GIU32932.1 hypothetical protein TUM4644_33370 [Shewanella colwelliana]
MITKFFTPSKEEEVLIESLNTPTELNDFMESFYYHVKTEATSEELKHYAQIVERHSDKPALFLMQIKLENKNDVIQLLESFNE